MQKKSIKKSKNKEMTSATARLDHDDFRMLPLAVKRSYLNTVLPKEKLALVLSDPENQALVRAMHPHELYWLFKENGGREAMELLALASPQQCVFILDMELWQGWSFSENKAVQYLGYILKGGVEHFLELLPHLDFNLMSLFLGRELLVAGGIGDINSDEVRQTDWDHTFDDVFLIKFKNPKHAHIIGLFLELICRFDNSLYTALMESVSGEIDSESEDECYRLKSGRLADLGFPPLDEAREIYSRIDPATFVPGRSKEVLHAAESTTLPGIFQSGSTFLERVILLVDSELFRMELNYLVNTALVADEAHLADMEQMQAVVERVHGYLNIALEYLSEGYETRGAEILTGEYLRRLFQLGFSLVIGLKIRGDRLNNDDYATGKVLAGLTPPRPRFYRGLDPDGIDGYREFHELQDVTAMGGFLGNLEG